MTSSPSTNGTPNSDRNAGNRSAGRRDKKRKRVPGAVSNGNGSGEVDDGRSLGPGFAVHPLGPNGLNLSRVTTDLGRDTTDLDPDAAGLGPALEDSTPATEVDGTDQRSRIEALEGRIRRLGAVCEAMWDVVSSELDLDLDRLTAKLQEISETDSAEQDHRCDGTLCPSCGNPKPVSQKLCLFCSARAPM